MAEERNDAQEKSQPATPRRIEQLREQGQVPRSQDLSATGVLIASALAAALLGGGVAETLVRVMRTSFTTVPPADPRDLYLSLSNAVFEGIGAIAPFLAVTAVAAVLASIALGGWILTGQALQPKWEKLDPLKGLRRRVFSARGLAEMLKAAAKFAVVGGVAVGLLFAEVDASLALARSPVETGLRDAAVLLAAAFAVLCAAMILIAAIDVPFQRWNFARQNRMSLEEVKRELRNEEGAPELRAKVRSLQREVASRRMMEAVPSADVVITNPTHFACALRYAAERRAAAPELVASGADLVAWQIRSRARASGVPVIESPALARAIYHSTPLGQEIPIGLYGAVAIVLKYAYRLRGRREFRDAPPPPDDLPIPAELRFE